MYMCIYVYMYISIYVYMYICFCIYIYIYIYVYPYLENQYSVKHVHFSTSTFENHTYDLRIQIASNQNSEFPQAFCLKRFLY